MRPSSCLSVLTVCNVGVLWSNSPMDQDATWYGSRRRPRPHCVRRELSSRHGRGTTALPYFSIHVYCGQTAGWIRIPLGTEVGIVPGDIVLDGDSASPTERGTAAPTFWPMSIVSKRSPISATAEFFFVYSCALAWDYAYLLVKGRSHSVRSVNDP